MKPNISQYWLLYAQWYARQCAGIICTQTDKGDIKCSLPLQILRSSGLKIPNQPLLKISTKLLSLILTNGMTELELLCQISQPGSSAWGKFAALKVLRIPSILAATCALSGVDALWARVQGMIWFAPAEGVFMILWWGFAVHGCKCLLLYKISQSYVMDKRPNHLNFFDNVAVVKRLGQFCQTSKISTTAMKRTKSQHCFKSIHK